MLLGYNTNGLAHHALGDAIDLLAEIGYRSVAITIDHGVLSPRDEHCGEQIERVREQLARHGLRSVIETGARFLLDPARKHRPTLMSPDAADRARRIAFYRHAVDVAAELGSDCVSLWSGALTDSISGQQAWARLVAGLEEVLEYATRRDVCLGFEPEPGMFIDTMPRYGQLVERLDAAHLRLTLDVGHLHCQGETPIADHIGRWSDRLVNVHIEDMRAGVHEHLMFGEGEMDFPPILTAFAEAGYAGPLHVELSRHSHMAPKAAQQAFSFLAPLLRATP